MVESMAKKNGVMEDVAAEIGYTAANALVDWFGGGNLHIPEKATEEHLIARVIGLPAMQRLVAMYVEAIGDKRMMHVPTGYERELARRDRMIGALFAEGRSVQYIMGVTNMSKRHVEIVRTKLDEIGMLAALARRSNNSEK
jgi:hypothetical protein